LFSDCLPFSCSFKCNRNPHIDFSSSRKTKNQKKKQKKKAELVKTKRNTQHTREIKKLHVQMKFGNSAFSLMAKEDEEPNKK